LAYGKDNKLLATTDRGALGEVFFISGEGQSVATIDLTIPEGVRWFQSLLRRTLALGYDGWMHDFGEYVRRDFRFGDGRTGAAVHNEYPVLSAKAAFDLLSQEKPGDFLFFVRSGYTGTQAWVPAVWGGDAEATFDETQGLPSAVRSGLNLGMSGVPLWGSDVTGFKCITSDPRDKEIYLRWAQVGAVSPIMMEQNACSHPLGRTKWKLWNDQETMDVYGAAARLHTRLAPYFDVQAMTAHDTGTPIMRHPFLFYPKHPEALRAESTFFLGPDLFALPVVRRGEREKEAWLPPGRWIDLDDNTVYAGDQRVRIPAPLSKLPLLLRGGGIVPMLDASVETLAPATDPSVVTRASVDDRMDVLVALSDGETASIKLRDGTELRARRGAVGAPSPAPATVEAKEVSNCQKASADAACVAVTQLPGFRRVQLTTAEQAQSRWVYEDLELTAVNPRARRVRWNVSLLPK
jgi:alpha-glucosidase (family GH31 glycosyl hydrolase)